MTLPIAGRVGTKPSMLQALHHHIILLTYEDITLMVTMEEL
jgi:hypothetical protein